ncbi:MAG: sigma-70 family RNA polymerase sigma factor [Clostridia bacterium]|nr:sigma-70 family RNA polymerase sigma factor [Clostridia bacterium]
MEEKLVALAQKGDENSINEIFTKYKPLVTIISRKFFLLNAEQNDLIQEGMIGLFKAYRSYNFSSFASFKTYASLCIKRQMQTAFEKNNRQKNRPLNAYLSISNQGKILLSSTTDENNSLDDENGFYLEESSLSPEESVIFREKLFEIADKINGTLSSYEKRVLKFFMSGMDYVEIANKLKKEPKSIDNALSRIKMKLKSLKGV